MIPPVASYRMQLRDTDNFEAARERLDHLERLGISHLYTSPVLAAVRGSSHFYDGVDPTAVADELGGDAGLRALVADLADRDMGWLADLVPNHLSVADPRQNRWWWETLRDGPTSPSAHVFDIDWAAGDGRVVLPVLGDTVDRLLTEGRLEIVDHDGQRAVSADGFVVPLRTDLDPCPDSLIDELAEQHHRLVPWREGGRNYRVFFDVDSLAGVRIEDDSVRTLVHTQLATWVRDDLIDGVRIDHVDGLAEPTGYLTALRALLGRDRWLMVEKILIGDEQLPRSWPVDGATGYDVAADIVRLLVDARGEDTLTNLLRDFGGDDMTYAEREHEAKAEVITTVLLAQTEQLAQLTDVSVDALTAAAVAFDVYRTYLPPVADEDRIRIDRSFRRASAEHPELSDELQRLRRIVLDPVGDREIEARTRWQQFTAPAMAKGAEDTAFYRHHRLIALNEVGSDPGIFSIPVHAWHEAAIRRAEQHPRSMVTTSTHDTKRSEDVRARLCVLSEISDTWAQIVAAWSERIRSIAEVDTVDRATELLIWQTIVGAWPIDVDRLGAYLTKATREAKLHTSWLDVNPEYEEALERFVRAALADLSDSIDRFVTDNLLTPGRLNSLSQVALRILGPGVPDLYQGCELWDLSLVDPDNRRPVDFTGMDRRWAAIGSRSVSELWVDPTARDGGLVKMSMIAELHRLRHRQSTAFEPGADYRAVDLGSRCIAFGRGPSVIAVIGRHPVSTQDDGYGPAALDLPAGEWTDVVTRRRFSGTVAVGDLLASLPVAALELDS